MIARSAARQWNAYTPGERLHQDTAFILGLSADMRQEPVRHVLWDAWNDQTGRVLPLLCVKIDA